MYLLPTYQNQIPDYKKYSMALVFVKMFTAKIAKNCLKQYTQECTQSVICGPELMYLHYNN